jgi:PAS domain S-box-containing protein
VPVHVWILIFVVLVVVGFLWYDLRAAYQETLTYWNSNLSNSADEQTSIETLWLLERRTDTEGIANNPATFRMLFKKVNEGQRAAIQHEVERAIDEMARINGFLGGAVADTECRILAQVGVAPEATEGVKRVCHEAQTTRAYSLVASYPRPAHILLNMAVPVSAGERVPSASRAPPPVIGAAVMISEPGTAVPRFFAERSRPDRFAETEILWKDGGQAAGFSPRFNAMGMGSLFRLALSGNAFESRAARERNVEFGEFTDYRGVRVFGVARSIAAAGASLTRKVDKDQALAEFHRRALLEGVAATLSLLLIGAVILAQHRQQAMRDLQEKLRQQQAVLDLKRYVEASEERYRAFVANSTEAIWRMETEKPISTALPVEEQVDQVLQFAYLAECNDSMAQMFGYERASDLIGLSVKNLAGMDPRSLANLRTFIRSGYRLADAEFQATDRLGKVHHFLNTYLGVVEGGYLLRAWGVLRDVTERKRVEEALQESERRYRVLFETAGDAIFLIRGDAFIDCNQRALEMYRCTRDEILGQAVAERYPPQESDGSHPRSAALEKLDQARDGQTLCFEWSALRRDGTTFEAEITLSRLGIEEDVILLALVRDITDRKRAERSLRESEELFRTTFETAGVGIALVDLQGRPMNSNPALQKMLGYNQEEFRHMRFTEFTHPDDRERDWELYQELIVGKRETYEIEKRFIRKDGQTVWGHLTASLVKGADGRLLYGVGIVEDITERKQAVEALRASETRFRTLIQRAPVAISISRSGRTLYANQAYLDMYGFQRIDEIIGHSIGEQWSPQCREMVEKRARQRARGLPVPTRYEAEGQRKDGSQFPVEVVVAMVELADGEASVGFLTDITERKRADAELVDRLRFETLLADLSARFADVVAERLGGEINGALRRVCECFGLDGCTLWQAPEATPRVLRLTYTSRSSEGPAGPGSIQMEGGEYFPWSHQQIVSGKRNVIAVSSLRDLPEEAARDRETYSMYGVKSVLTIALAAGGRPPVGALAFSSTQAEQSWPEEIVNRLQLVAQVFANALARQRLQAERQRSFDQLRALAARLQSVREEERKRVAREIHDQLGQALTAIKLDLSSLVRGLPAGQSTILEKGAPLLRLVDETIESVRRISTELRPGMLDDLGLAATVEWAAEEFASRTGTKCLLDLATEEIAVGSETATAVFRIFQETLTNVARHAKASEVKVRLAEENGDLTLEVCDNGRGIGEDDLARANSLGILGMRERALLLGGTLTITGDPGKGTTVRLRIPEVRPA